MDRKQEGNLRYSALEGVLQRAYDQAATGKGAERHARSRPFEEQPMLVISDLLGTTAGLLYQAMKKIQESQNLPKDRAVVELLGAINYLAGAVVFLEDEGAEYPSDTIVPRHFAATGVAEYLLTVLSQRQIVDMVLSRPDFPACRTFGNSRLWNMEEVSAWASAWKGRYG